MLRGLTGARLCGRSISEDSLLLGASCAGRLFELSKNDVWSCEGLGSEAMSSSERVVSELRYDSVDVSDLLWLPASDGETGSTVVSPCDAGLLFECCLISARDLRPKEPQRKWDRDLVLEADDLILESTLAVEGAMPRVLSESEFEEREWESSVVTSSCAGACGSLVVARFVLECFCRGGMRATISADLMSSKERNGQS